VKPSRSSRSRVTPSPSDDAAPVRLNVGHRWTSAETRAIARGIGGRARAKHYPGLVRLWAINAARIRWNRVRAREARPLLELVWVPKVDTPRAIEMRERWTLARRRQEYDQAAARVSPRLWT